MEFLQVQYIFGRKLTDENCFKEEDEEKEEAKEEDFGHLTES